MASRGLRKHIFFHLEACERRNFDFCVLCSYGCVVGPCSYTCLGLSRMCSYTDPLHIRKNTQKSKFLLSQAFKWKKIMFFVISEMPSKTFVMVLKKLPDRFKIEEGEEDEDWGFDEEFEQDPLKPIREH